MGGKKKLSLKQMERTQTKKDEEKPTKTEKKKDTAEFKKEKKTLNIAVPDTRNEKIVGEIRKMRVLTPHAVASRFDIRISVAKDFLEELEKQGVVKLISQSRNTRIYSAAA